MPIMHHAFLRRWRLTPAMVLLTVLAAACASAPAAPAPGTPQPPAEMKVKMQLGPGSFDLPDPRIGLADLSSYRTTLKISFDGKEQGQPAQWTRTYALLSSREPPARLWTMESTQDTARDEPVARAEAEGAAYEISSTGRCTTRVLDPASPFAAQFEPAALLKVLLGAETAGHEALEGIEAEHYTFDERALLLTGLAKSSGEVWVATQGGYVLRYLETTTAGDKFFGEGIEGKLELDYELTEINQPLTIELPPGCPPGLVAAPTMADAANVLSTPGELRYESASSIADVLAFYDKELPTLGWVDPSTITMPDGVNPGVSPEQYLLMLAQMQAMGMAQPTPVPSESEGMHVFEQGGRRLSVFITREGSTTTVLLSLTNIAG
jgi:hypothetical protein